MDLIADLKLITDLFPLVLQAGKTVTDLIPELVLLGQIFAGKSLTPEQRTVLQARHQELTDAALRPLGDKPADAT